MSEHVRIDRAGGVLAITLARPERRNAITVAMYDALASAIEGAAGDGSVRCITLRGEGQDFAAGNDLADFLAAGTRDLEEIPVWRLLRALAQCEIPLIAAVHGNCVGIGTTILLHCDLVVADDSAKFSLPFVDLGLVPEAASSLLFPELAGRRRASRYLLLGESFGPDEALDIGLISHRAATGTLETALDQIVERLMAKPAEALAETQRLLRHGRRDQILDRMKLESDLFSKRLQSDEVRQAITAFFAARVTR
ncbi:MAG TPA: enoyl-CoA hydratase-related protein [Sphingomicrobium sp.]|nr:enoyl-CoA hydratase-related protein [Sphingomicrobium sp.]